MAPFKSCLKFKLIHGQYQSNMQFHHKIISLVCKFPSLRVSSCISIEGQPQHMMTKTESVPFWIESGKNKNRLPDLKSVPYTAFPKAKRELNLICFQGLCLEKWHFLQASAYMIYCLLKQSFAHMLVKINRNYLFRHRRLNESSQLSFTIMSCDKKLKLEEKKTNLGIF